MGEPLFSEVGRGLQHSGMTLKTDTIVDATIFTPPSPTKNSAKKRDSEIHQTRKGQQWHFGMKRHIRVDSQSSLAHSAVVTAADVHDKYPLPDLLHGHEQRVYGDHAYMSPNALIHCKAPKAKDFTNCRTSKPSRDVDEVKRSKNRNKSKNRARVEHLFAVVKQLLGGRYESALPRSLVKNPYLLVNQAIDGTGVPVVGEQR